MFYRVLNPSTEKTNTILSSDYKSEFRRKVLNMWPLCEDVYKLSESSGMSIKGALMVAQNVPAFIDILNDYISAHPHVPMIPLLSIGVKDKFVIDIPYDILIGFSHQYLKHANELEIYFDYDNLNVIWEYLWEKVRQTHYPQCYSRLDSVFLFNNKKDAELFQNAHRTPTDCIAQISIVSGDTQSYDSEWLNMCPSDITVSEAADYVRKYWEGEKTPEPQMEYLLQGKYSWSK